MIFDLARRRWRPTTTSLDQLEGASKASLRWQRSVVSGSNAERVEALNALLDVAATAEIDPRLIDAKLAAIEAELAGAGEVRAHFESHAAELRRQLAHAATANDRAELAVAVAALRRDLDLSKRARR